MPYHELLVACFPTAKLFTGKETFVGVALAAVPPFPKLPC
jgi:hypothetical protein